ncbi:MAG: sugar phosphate isomerase/epimerase [Oscillospiraceae bacterium]|nr:sugar phosphate isomerase/epimerase [Oscillospiraceae bacterium]
MIGISTSCYYPLETETALEKIGQAGARTCELFINSESETRPHLLGEFIKIKEYYGIEVNSVHCMTFAEPFSVFSNYYRRFLDSIDEYKRVYEACTRLGSGICVFHGERLPAKIDEEEYFERVAVLSEAAREEGVVLTQENVVNFRSQSTSFLRRMRKYLGSNFKLTLDVKQAVRSQKDPAELAEIFAQDIINVHISDHDVDGDCLPPLSGSFDFGKLFTILNDHGYRGNYIIELYRDSYEDEAEIVESYKNIEKLYNIYCNH